MNGARRRRPQGGKCADPAWRRERARRANAARRVACERRREALGDRYATKGLAYLAGYRQGYITAMRWWTYRTKRKGAA